jgi:predicted ATPase/DNA-binding CsgD family transcriptional regulator
LSSFVGREHEIAEIKRLLETTRLLTITGAGGSGKTRLALRVAADLVDDYADGVWMIELASLSDPALVARTAASVLGITEPPTRPLNEVIGDSLRSKSALLIFDNCEHVLPAAAELIDGVLQACPGVRVMTTSREALRNTGEVAWRVPPMSLPAAARMVDAEHLMKYEAVRLFVERAAAVAPALPPTLETTQAVVRICQRLDGIPLAIELAAARVRALSVDQIAARLDDRFALLTDGSRTAPPRQRTLQAAIDWSHALLSEPERIVFRRLAVFVGGWTLEAAEAVCAGSEVAASQILDLLTQLIDKSLVIADAQEETRYRFLETIRHYASDRLAETGESSDVRTRHLDWYGDLAQRAERALWTGPGRETWLDRLEAELDNLRSALAWSRVAHDGGDRFLRLAAALLYFWIWRDHYHEGFEWLEQALSRTRGDATLARAQALSAAAFLALGLDGSRPVVDWCEEGLMLSREFDDAAAIGRFLRVLALAVDDQGDHERARALLADSLDIYRRTHDTTGVAAALAFLGLIVAGRHDYDAARAAFEESLALSRGCGYDIGVTLALSNLAALALDQGDTRRARDLVAQALRGATTVAFKGVGLMCLVQASRLAAMLGRHTEAARLSGAADGQWSALGGAFIIRFARAGYERSLAGAREALGETAFNAASAEGRAMSLEQALECAIAFASLPIHVSSTRQHADVAGPGPLTRREREVAILIAQGLSNRAIAARLVISDRTVETHVQHIFTKLGLEARAQIAAWVVRCGLLPVSGNRPADAGPPS